MSEKKIPYGLKELPPKEELKLTRLIAYHIVKDSKTWKEIADAMRPYCLHLYTFNMSIVHRVVKRYGLDTSHIEIKEKPTGGYRPLRGPKKSQFGYKRTIHKRRRRHRRVHIIRKRSTFELPNYYTRLDTRSELPQAG